MTVIPAFDNRKGRGAERRVMRGAPRHIPRMDSGAKYQLHPIRAQHGSDYSRLRDARGSARGTPSALATTLGPTARAAACPLDLFTLPHTRILRGLTASHRLVRRPPREQVRGRSRHKRSTTRLGRERVAAADSRPRSGPHAWRRRACERGRHAYAGEASPTRARKKRGAHKGRPGPHSPIDDKIRGGSMPVRGSIRKVDCGRRAFRSK
jgi:hypothetical protein